MDLLQICNTILIAQNSVNMIIYINRRKQKDHMIILISAENAFGKI